MIQAVESKPGEGMTLRTVYSLTVLSANGCYCRPEHVSVRVVMLDADSLCMFTPIRWHRYEVLPS